VIGPPMILQSNNGKEFLQAAMTARRQNNENSGKLIALTQDDLTKIIAKVRELWPECCMVRGLPRHSPSNGGVERVNRPVEDKLGSWMRENRNTNWSVGCHLIMWRYNTQVHRTMKSIPYECMFGQAPCVGISSLPLDEGLINLFSTKAQLNRVSDFKGKIEVTNDNVGDLVVPPDLENDENIVGIDVTDNFSVDDMMEVVDTAMSECDNRSPTDNQKANTTAEDAGEVIGGENEACTAELSGEDEDEDEDDSLSEASDTPVAQIVAGAFTGNTNSTGLADEDLMTAWHCAVNELPEDLVIGLEYLSNLKLRESVPIAWCVDTNQVCEMQSFVPAFSTRVTKHMWEQVTDVDELIIQNLDCKGDEGIENMMGTFCIRGKDSWTSSS
jgi:hypothetical protein